MQNCWEVKNCGRQPGGVKTQELGVCKAALETRTEGVNHGKNAGRCCWAISGTLCGGQVQGSFAMKLHNCMSCNFYQQVSAEEGRNLVNSKDILARMS